MSLEEHQWQSLCDTGLKNALISSLLISVNRLLTFHRRVRCGCKRHQRPADTLSAVEDRRRSSQQHQSPPSGLPPGKTTTFICLNRSSTWQNNNTHLSQQVFHLAKQQHSFVLT